MVTFKQVRMFNLSVDSFLGRNPEAKNTKLGYAITKVSQNQISKIVKEYQDAYSLLQSKMVWEKQVDLALTDKVTGAVLNAPEGSVRPFLFDKEGLKATVANERIFVEEWKKESEKFDSKEYALDPHYIKDIPDDLTDDEKEAFTGFVIAPKYSIGVRNSEVIGAEPAEVEKAIKKVRKL